MAKKKAGWVHPTGNTPERVAILGLGPTNQDWHAAHVQYNPPLAPVDEVWCVNKGFRTTKCDLVFIMDDLVDEARQSPRYGDEIASAGIPVITSTTDALVKGRWPAALQYPLREVLGFWGHHLKVVRTGKTDIDPDEALQSGLENIAYFHNSIPYILAYAGMLGVKNICLFGCDYTFPGSPAREDDRANAEFWVGMLMACGVGFQFPSRTTLLSKNEGRKFYGFNGRQPF